MSTPTTTSEHPVGEEHHAAHPSDKQYVMIGLILGAFTAVEVGLYYVDIGALTNPTLLLLAVVKFTIVVMYFMHLKFDKPILRRLFVTGLILAFGVYLIYLMTLGVYVPGG